MSLPNEVPDDIAARVDLLIRALSDPHVSVGWNASRELAKLGTAACAALPELTAALRSHDANKALWARYAVAKITGDVAKHLPAFIEALDDRRIFPGMASFALSGFGPDAAPAILKLIEDLNDANADQRWSAAGALAAIGPAAAAAVPALATTLNDPDEKVRLYATWALEEIGPAAIDAVPALIDSLDDIDDDVRGHAAIALGAIGDAGAYPAIERLLNDENPAVAEAAGRALASSTSTGRAVHPERGANRR